MRIEQPVGSKTVFRDMVDQVRELLFRVEFFVESHNKVKAVYLRNEPTNPIEASNYANLPLPNIMVLIANVFFFEAVSCIASLLREEKNDPSENEISFDLLKANLSGSKRELFDAKRKIVFQQYKGSGLESMRNKNIDHKDAHLNYPAATFVNFVAEEYVDQCLGLIYHLKELFIDFFPDKASNNYFMEYYSPGIMELMAIFESRNHERVL